MQLDRRDFCKLGALSALPVALAPRLVFAEGKADPNRDVLVCVFQRGGMDGLNTVAPYADPAYRSLRPTVALPEPGTGTDALLDLDGFFGLNPAASALKPLYDSGKLAIMHAIGGLHGDLSHFSAQALMERGALANVPVYSGWLNRHLQIIGSGSEFQAVGVGTAIAPSLFGEAPVIGISSIDSFALVTDSSRAAQTPSLLKAIYAGEDPLERSGVQAFDAIDVLDSAAPAQFPVENGAQYPDTPFGRQMREVAQLIKAGIGLEVACVDIGGWDHHNQLNAALTPLLQQFANTLAAFHADLGTRMDTSVTVITMSEFGRRAYENASAGTDHGIGGVMFALGAGVNGGEVYADWPGMSTSQLLDGNLSITIDYRTVLSELLAKRASNTETTAVFPGYVDAGALNLYRSR